MLGLTGTLTRNCASQLFTTFSAQAASNARRIHSTALNPCRPIITRSKVLSSVIHRTIQDSPNALRICKRCKSTFAIDASVRKVASGLAQTQPAFTVSANMITVLREPTDFYGLLLDMIRRAEQRIFISSLYIGSAESELIEAIQKSLSEKPSLRLHLQLDLNRSTRPGVSSTAKILLPLLQEFPDRVTVSMFRSPSLRGFLAKIVPPRFNEGWGTWHAKIYGVDDEVIISGANLNKSYFTNRQDRYIHFANQPSLAQYCFNFLQTISTFSYRLSTKPGAEPHSYQQENYFLDWPDPQTHPHEIHVKAQEALSAFQLSQRTIHGIQIPSSSNMFYSLNLHASEGRPAEQRRPLIDLTSGYFGLYVAYQNLVLANDVTTRIIAASPKANGFYGSKGISGRIPEGYTLLEQQFMTAVKRAGRLWKQGTGVQLTEWEKDGWTYHAKGIWVSPSPSSPPVLTLFGSTNLNSRSAHIDTELSFVMILQGDSSPVQKQLKDEIDGLRVHASGWKGGQRNVRLWTKVIVRLVKGML
ncbi:CDP-diacylglycerol--glycerol-3-phosphate 3-phosphatidyltransferase, mitochondrial [Termitomyces sp. J132]|nr:CDP-diacylglycerol--glycerol-3-phosphate 3-phosphatidyltransferase, mitochondrial [Termitomyces sp. J132]